MRRPRGIWMALMLVAAPGSGCAPTHDAAAEPRVEAAADAGLYDLDYVPTIAIQFADEGWERELETLYGSDEELHATVTVDGATYLGVGISFRGQSSYRRVDYGSKRSLNLSFDAVHDGQNVQGYRTLNLLNAMNDPTFVRAVLYSQISRDYIAAPMVNFARVSINGEPWGIYLSAQQFNKDFLRDFFGTDEGGRWKVPGSPRGRAGLEYLGEDPDLYRPVYEIRSRDEPESWRRLIELTRVLHRTPEAELEAALEPILDVDGTLRFLALDVALSNSDGYWTRASDYNLYLDEAGRFHLVPHDMNEALGVGLGGGRGGGFGGGPIAPERLDPLVALEDPTKPLRSRLLAVPELRERYLGYVRDIAQRWMDWGVVGPIVERHQALIADDVRADTRKLYDNASFTSGVENLRSFMDQRREFLLR